MPNIEIYGLSSESGDFEKSLRCNQLKLAIRRAVDKLGLGAEAVITEIRSRVERCDGSPAPFIRVLSTPLSVIPFKIQAVEVANAIVCELALCKEDGIDVEVLSLDCFFEAKK